MHLPFDENMQIRLKQTRQIQRPHLHIQGCWRIAAPVPQCVVARGARGYVPRVRFSSWHFQKSGFGGGDDGYLVELYVGATVENGACGLLAFRAVAGVTEEGCLFELVPDLAAVAAASHDGKWASVGHVFLVYRVLRFKRFPWVVVGERLLVHEGVRWPRPLTALV
jgi:hypothetical protein